MQVKEYKSEKIIVIGRKESLGKLQMEIMNWIKGMKELGEEAPNFRYETLTLTMQLQLDGHHMIEKNPFWEAG